MVCALLQVCSSHSTEVTWQFIYICSEECRMEYEKWASPALSFLRILSETPRNVWMNPLIKPPKCTMTAAFLYSNMQAARSSPEMRRELPSLHSFSPAVRWDGAGVLLSFGFSLFFCFFFFFPWWNEVPDSGTNGRTQRCARAQPGGGKWEECAGAGLLAGRERCAQAHALALRTKCMRTESRWGSPRACAKSPAAGRCVLPRVGTGSVRSSPWQKRAAGMRAALHIACTCAQSHTGGRGQCAAVPSVAAALRAHTTPEAVGACGRARSRATREESAGVISCRPVIRAPASREDLLSASALFHGGPVAHARYLARADARARSLSPSPVAKSAHALCGPRPAVHVRAAACRAAVAGRCVEGAVRLWASLADTTRQAGLPCGICLRFPKGC